MQNETSEIISRLREYAGGVEKQYAKIANRAAKDLESLILPKESFFSRAKLHIIENVSRYAKSAALAGLLLFSGVQVNQEKKYELPKKPSVVRNQEYRGPKLPAIILEEEKPYVKRKAPVLMYHKIADVEDRYTVSADRLHDHLDQLRLKGYDLMTYTEYVKGEYSAASKPAVLTFDDSTEGQFRIDCSGIDPKSAVGVLEQYKKEHPDFKVTATFFVNFKREGKPAFEQQDSETYKLQYLITHGYEIGAHSMRHSDFAKLSLDQVKKDVREFKDEMGKRLPDYEVKSFAYPYGSLPSKEAQKIVQEAFPYTAHAWGGVAQGEVINTPRIEIGPQYALKRILKGPQPLLASENPQITGGNVYKGEQNLTRYARHNSQLQAQYQEASRQPDDRGSRWRGYEGQGEIARRQDSPVQHRQKGDQRRDPLKPRQQGRNQSALRDRYARTSDWPARQDPVNFFSLLTQFYQPIILRKY